MELLVASIWTLIFSALTIGIDKRLAPVVIPAVIVLALCWIVSINGGIFIAQFGTGATSAVWRIDSLKQGVLLSTIAMLAFSSGGLVGGLAARRQPTSLNSGTKLASLKSRADMDQPHRALSLYVSSVALIALFLAIYGPSQVISRNSYLTVWAVPALASSAIFILPFAAAALTASSTMTRSRIIRVLTIMTALVEVLILLGTGSRVLALLPGIYVITRFALGRRLGTVRLVSAVVFTAVGLGLAVTLRGNPTGHGLVPYAHHILADPIGTIATGLNSTLSNLAFSVPLVGAVPLHGHYTLADFWVSVSPLSGGAAGWDALAPTLGFNNFVPYNGLGELSSISPVLMAVVCFLLSLSCAIALRLRPGAALSTVVTVMYVFIGVLLLQYNLRSSFRVIYALALVYALRLLYAAHKRRETPHQTPAKTGLTS